jgi:hypothetical protein
MLGHTLSFAVQALVPEQVTLLPSQHSANAVHPLSIAP